MDNITHEYPQAGVTRAVVPTVSLLLELRRLERLESELNVTVRLALEDLAASRAQRRRLLADLAAQLEGGAHLPHDDTGDRHVVEGAR